MFLGHPEPGTYDPITGSGPSGPSTTSRNRRYQIDATGASPPRDEQHRDDQPTPTSSTRSLATIRPPPPPAATGRPRGDQDGERRRRRTWASTITYTVTLGNHGPSDAATNVSISDPLPQWA